MRKALLFLIFIAIVFGCNTTEEGYLIKGVIKGDDIPLKNGVIYIQKANTKSVFDSTVIKNGRFRFKGKLLMPDRYMIFMKELNHNIPIYLENTEFRVEAFSDRLREANVIGGETQDLMNKTASKSRSVMTKYNLNHILGELIKTDLSEELRGGYVSVVNRANNEMKSFIDSIVASNPTSFYALLNLNEVVNVAKIEQVQMRVENFVTSGKFEGNSYLIKIKEILEKRKVLEPGKVAPDFTLLSLNDSMVTFSKIYRSNNFTILIFWSSWSNESIQFCKEIADNYTLFQRRGVEIVGITVGDVQKNWEEKIRDENFSWLQLKDSKEVSVTSLYNVQMIPRAILVNREGKIIMNNNPAKEILNYLVRNRSNN